MKSIQEQYPDNAKYIIAATLSSFGIGTRFSISLPSRLERIYEGAHLSSSGVKGHIGNLLLSWNCFEGNTVCSNGEWDYQIGLPLLKAAKEAESFLNWKDFTYFRNLGEKLKPKR